MTAAQRILVPVGIALILASCSDNPPDLTVVLEHEVIPAQPWVATGELVDTGELCPSGDRHTIAMWHPNGSPMSLQQFGVLIEESLASGLDVWHVRRITEREHLCDDGSGAFTLREDANGAIERATAEVVGGTGAYTDMTGTCVVDLTEDESRQIATMVTTCEFEFGPGDG